MEELLRMKSDKDREKMEQVRKIEEAKEFQSYVVNGLSALKTSFDRLQHSVDDLDSVMRTHRTTQTAVDNQGLRLADQMRQVSEHLCEVESALRKSAS